MAADRVFGNSDEALMLRARRSTLLASNLANADTPGYKAKDIDFRDALKTSQSSMMQMQRTDSRHLSVGNPGLHGAEVKYRNPEQPSLDGNTVDSQEEKARFMENAVRYQTTLSFLSSKVKGLKGAIKGE